MRNAYQTKALYSLTVTHMWCANAYHTQHITHSFYYQWFTQMCTKQKFYSLSILLLSHTWWYTQLRTTHKISHIQCIKTMKFVIRHTHIRIYKILSYLYAYTHMRKRRLTGRTRDFRLREKKMVTEILYLDWAEYCHNGVHVYKVLWWMDSQK